MSQTSQSMKKTIVGWEARNRMDLSVERRLVEWDAEQEQGKVTTFRSPT